MGSTDNPKKIAIFTTFDSYLESYSLTRIASEQIKMMLRNGYTPTVIVAEGFEPKGAFASEGVIIKHIPRVACHNEVKKDETFDEDVTKLAKALEEILKDIDVVISHDVIYQNASLKHNFAARQIAQKYPTLKWLHWIHSATSPVTLDALRPIFQDQYLQLVQTPFPNSKYVFFNHYSIPRIANDFNVSEDQVRVVHHPSDLSQVLALSEKVDKFAKENGIYSADVICVYPCRLDRGKNVEVAIKTMAQVKEFGLKIKMIVVDFQSTGGDKLTYRDELKQTAIDWGYSQGELLFTSEVKEWELEVPYDECMGIVRLANVFIMPSKSESYSLVTQEAGMMRNVVVLNQDFPPFRDIFGPNAIFKKYSSNFDILADLAEASGNTNTEYGPTNASPEERKSFEKKYHRATAGTIIARLKHPEMALSTFLRKYRNLDWVFKHELEPLFFE